MESSDRAAERQTPGTSSPKCSLLTQNFNSVQPEIHRKRQRCKTVSENISSIGDSVSCLREQTFLCGRPIGRITPSVKGKGPVGLLDIALLHDEHMLRSALQSRKWQLIGMS